MPSGSPSRRGVLTALGAVALTSAACSTDDPARPSGPGPSAPAVPSSPAGPSSAGPSASSRTAASRAAGAPPPPGPDLTHGPRSRPAVALTFHGAGDVSVLRRMLAIFADAGASVTVLAVGQWLAQSPEAARLVLDGGHELGNHTWSHRTMPALAPDALRAEVERAAAELRRVSGGPGRWFRPSGTPHSTPAIRAAAVAAGYGACLAYDVDPLDYTDPGPDAVVRAVGAAVRPGSVVSLHLGHPGTLAAMPGILGLLHQRGLAAVTASDLLASS